MDSGVFGALSQERTVDAIVDMLLDANGALEKNVFDSEARIKKETLERLVQKLKIERPVEAEIGKEMRYRLENS